MCGRLLGLRSDDDLEAEQQRTNNPSKLFIVFITILIRPGHVRRAAVAGVVRSKTTADADGARPFFYTTNVRRSRPTAKIYLWRSSVRLCSKNDTAARFDGKTISVCGTGQSETK